MIRKGSHQHIAKRSDYEEIYASRSTPARFNVPNSAERVLQLENEKVRAVIKDGILVLNIGNSIAFNVNISLFLNVLIADQQSFSVGDIPPMAGIPLSKMDDVIESWKQAISKKRNESYSQIITHGCCVLIEFTDNTGINYSQSMQIAISWNHWWEEHGCEISNTDVCNEPIEVKEKISFEAEINNLVTEWNDLIKSKSTSELEKIDEARRELAWTIYQSGSANADVQVFKLFNFCRLAQSIGKGIMAFEEINGLLKTTRPFFKIPKRKNDEEDERIKLLDDHLVDGANALEKWKFRYPEEDLDYVGNKLFS